MTSHRDEIRQLLLNEDEDLKKERVTIRLKGKSTEVEVREPTVDKRGSIFRVAGVVGGESKTDLAALQVHAVLHCTYVPDTDTLVFDGVDAKALRGKRASGFVDKLSSIALRLMNVDIEDAKKNSETTDGGEANSSSPTS